VLNISSFGLRGVIVNGHAGTMIGDVSVTSRAKARNFSRLPLISTGGVVGPLLQAALAHRAGDSAFWQRFPILSSQLACAGLMLVLFMVNLVLLKEVCRPPPPQSLP